MEEASEGTIDATTAIRFNPIKGSKVSASLIVAFSTSFSMASKNLVIGGTGYIGKYIVNASIDHGFPTYLLVRPSASQDPKKTEFLDSVKAKGAKILHGSLEDHSSLVAAIKQVDVVISAVGGAQIHEQTKIIDAIKEAGNIKRFLPSEYGTDPAKCKKLLPTLEMVYGTKLMIRKAVEEAGIPYTIVSSNTFAGFSLASLMQPGHFTPPRDKVTIYGDGNTKAICVDEVDIATYIVKAAVDQRTLNKAVYIRPPTNILSLNEIVALWEKKIGKKLEKSYVPEQAMLKNIEETPFPDNIMPAIVHSIFVQGDQFGFDVELEATKLYPEVSYTTVDEYLSRFV